MRILYSTVLPKSLTYQTCFTPAAGTERCSPVKWVSVLCLIFTLSKFNKKSNRGHTFSFKSYQHTLRTEYADSTTRFPRASVTKKNIDSAFSKPLISIQQLIPLKPAVCNYVKLAHPRSVSLFEQL